MEPGNLLSADAAPAISKRDQLRDQLQRQVDLFNRIAPVPSDITLRKANGEIIATRTASEAWILAGCMAVVQLDGLAGCWSLDRVALIPKERPLEDRLAAAVEGKTDAVASPATEVKLYPPFATYTDNQGTRIVGGSLKAPAHPKGSEPSSQHDPTSKGGNL